MESEGASTNPLPPRYRDRRTTRFAEGERVSEFQAFERQAYKRLDILEAAPTKEALMKLPGNHFEALGGNRNGQYSRRITSNGVSVLNGLKTNCFPLI